MHAIVEPTSKPESTTQPPVTWHVDDIDWTPLTGLFIRKAGYKTVIAPEFTQNAYSIELTTVGVGGSSPTHVEPWAHVFYIVSGHGEVTVEDEVKEVRPGSVSPIAAGQPHSFRVLGNEPLEMLVIYHPPRKREPAPPAINEKLDVRVRQMRREADSVISLEFESAAAGGLPPYEPGAHIDIDLPNGVTRSYSLCGATPNVYRIGVLKDRASRGGSAFIHEQLRLGDVLKISTPRNNFPLREGASHNVLIAGGIGITPILSMLRKLAEDGKPTELIYAARSRSEAAFLQEVEALGVRVTSHFDDEQGGPPDLTKIMSGRPPGTYFYACGPAPMLNAFEAAGKSLDLAHCYVERFSAVRKTAAIDAKNRFEVVLARSGHAYQIPESKSILDTLLEHGVAVQHSCKEGICGACRTKVIDGRPDHRDSVLTPEEREAGAHIMVCVSGCKSEKLVLDL